MFERTKDLKLSVIKQIELEASKYVDSISLAQGIASFDTPECIKRRVQLAMERGVVSKYSLSPGLPELRELIEVSLAKENMFYDWEKEVVVTAGSIEAITATILAITNPGDEIIIPNPTYTSYREVITMAGCKAVYTPLVEELEWSMQIDQLAKEITPKTKAIFYCNPNNPTGTVYSKEQLIKLGELAEKYNLFIISDDVYKDFIYDEKVKFFSLAEIPELRKRVIRIFSFSKAYSMTGWRVGYVHSDAEIMKEILKVHDCLVTCAPVISQYAAMGALEMADKDILLFKNEFKKRCDYACTRLDKLNEVFSYVKPNSSYYVFPHIANNSDSVVFAQELLEKTHVAVVPGLAFGPNGKNNIRINFGRSEQDLCEAFDRIEKYFKNK
jgi:aminotransferase